MEQPLNPFILGHKIRRPYFCDRINEQIALESAVSNGRNVVMISPRRMGKTALVYLTLHESALIRDNYHCFFFDILSTASLREFTFLLGKTIYSELQPKGQTAIRSFLSALKSIKGSFGFDPATGRPTLDLQLGDIKNPEYTLEEIFNYIEQSDRPVIIFIDEFQQVAKYPEKNMEALLRSYMQNMSNATFIFAGSEQSILQEMFVSPKRPFYNSTEIMHLSPIPKEQYLDFAQGLFRERGREIETEAVSHTFDLMDGNTYYIQRTMNGAFADTRPGGVCTLDTVHHTIRGMLAANSTVYREILSGITESQKATLYAIAACRIVEKPTSGPFIKANALASASSVQSALQKLIKAGLLKKTNEGYSLTDPLFRIFINEVYGRSEV